MFPMQEDSSRRRHAYYRVFSCGSVVLIINDYDVISRFHSSREGLGPRNPHGHTGRTYGRIDCAVGAPATPAHTAEEPPHSEGEQIIQGEALRFAWLDTGAPSASSSKIAWHAILQASPRYVHLVILTKGRQRTEFRRHEEAEPGKQLSEDSSQKVWVESARVRVTPWLQTFGPSI